MMERKAMEEKKGDSKKGKRGFWRIIIQLLLKGGNVLKGKILGREHRGG